MPTWKFDTQTVVMIVGWALTVAGLYFGLTSKLDMQAVSIATLTEQARTSDANERALERALIELTVTLRELIK